MSNPDQRLTIGDLAKAAAVNVETIRFYQRKGLMPEPDRPAGGIRRYGEEELSRLGFIKTAQRLGFSLDEIADLLKLEDGSGCVQARQKAKTKLADVRAKLADLHRMEDALASLIKLCGAAKGKVRCPLIAALKRTPAT
jgi:MerR family transcriptional regulator, mercuric resistance operon regulatory protein